MGVASGWDYTLPLPPPAGRWITIGGGGQEYYALTAPRDGVPGDDLEWNPPVAHLPVPFGLIAERIRRKQRRLDGEP